MSWAEEPCTLREGVKYMCLVMAAALQDAQSWMNSSPVDMTA
jgi:hypothetical protein